VRLVTASVLRRLYGQLEGDQYEPRVRDEQKESFAQAEDAPQPREQRGNHEYEPDQCRPGQPGQQSLSECQGWSLTRTGVRPEMAM
jgi:hypothetical protein